MIVPQLNEKNIKEDLTEELRNEMTIHYVSTIEEILEMALMPEASTVPATSTKETEQLKKLS